MDCPEGKNFGMAPEEEVTRAEEDPVYNELSECEKRFALFTDGSGSVVAKLWRRKAFLGSPP